VEYCIHPITDPLQSQWVTDIAVPDLASVALQFLCGRICRQGKQPELLPLLGQASNQFPPDRARTAGYEDHTCNIRQKNALSKN
jgi:hypothetical protein